MNTNTDRVINGAVISVIIGVIVLKITNVIKIPWIWLLCPIWIVLGFGTILAFVLTLACLFHIKINKGENKNERY
jgi:energy-coupling factor transporter transmembrane protein EcfT